MKLYAVTIGNKCSDEFYTKLVLSFEALTKDNENINKICNVDTENFPYEYIQQVEVAKILTNPWSEEEANEMQQIIDKLK